ncbi:MAG: TonB-dependent receptor, partial [Bryobacteraceae bacterium]|nr:TonB-dependent receptor [Bryobacteraceae bacterium]
MRLVFVATVVLLLAAPVAAQTFYGSVVGTVTDPTGAVVPEVNVVLTNIGTAERRAMRTDAQGNYLFVNLVPGRYRLDLQKDGFKRLTREPVLVEVQSAVRIDVTLEVGEVTQTVEVSAETPLMQTENASLGQVVEARKVLEMPLNGRNVLNLVTLVPGVVPQGQSMQNPTGTNPFAWGNYQIGGGQANQSAAYLDGGPVNVSYINLTALVPTQDSIQEFRVQTNSLGAEFGRFAGGVINLTTKSGTNNFHGTVYEFLRNKVLNANTFFNNRSGIERPAFTQNQFGANLGGPILRDRLFFFGSYEGFRLRQGQSFTYTVPTEAMRRGDFSNVRTATGALVPIYDPLTTCGRLGNAPCGFDASGREIITRQPFPNNTIPNSRIDRAARAMIPLWALPNGPGLPFTAVNNFTTNASVGGNNDQGTGRIDYTASDKQRIFGRFTRWTNLNLPIDPYRTKTCVDRCTETFVTDQVVLADTYTVSPTTVLDVRLAFLRFSYDRTPETLGYDLTQLGWPSELNRQVVFRVQPIPRVQGYNDVFATNGTGSRIIARNDSYSIVPSLTKIAGRHTWKFGAEVRRLTHNYYQENNPSGAFDFDALFTAQNPFTASGGNGFASFLLGYGTGGGLRQAALVAGQQIYRSIYASDTIQLTSRLTLNLGLRYEGPGPWSERFDRMTVLLPRAPSPIVGPDGRQLLGRLALVNSPDHPSRNNTNMYHLFAPRAGLAWRAFSKTVIRAGYGLFFVGNDVVFAISPNNDLVNGFNNPFVGTLDGSLTPANVLSNPFPNGLLPAPGRSQDVGRFFAGVGIQGPLPGDPYPTVQQWNFSIQREIPSGAVVEAAYAGSKGTHLPAYTQQINQLPDQFLSLGADLQRQVDNPFFGQITTGALAARTVALGQLLRPFPHHTSVAIGAPANRNSIYHSLQVKSEKRFSQGGSVLLAYTWAKLISDTDTLTGWLEPGGGFAAQNNNNLRLERSLANYDVRHRLVISYVLDLPFGKGQRFASGVTGAADKLISGWGINGVTTFQTG